MKSHPYYDLDSTYMNPYMSYMWIQRWMDFQFPAYFEKQRFIQRLFAWLNRSAKKRLMFTLVGPPDSAKTTIMTSACLFVGPYGKISNVKNASSFVTEQCCGVRSIIVDEVSQLSGKPINLNPVNLAHFEPILPDGKLRLICSHLLSFSHKAVVDDVFANHLKDMCSGKGSFVPQKHKKSVWQPPTPICFLSNFIELFGGRGEDPTVDVGSPWHHRMYWFKVKTIIHFFQFKSGKPILPDGKLRFISSYTCFI